MKLLDKVEAKLTNGHRRTPNTLWPSSASAWMPCESCGGAGSIPNHEGTMPCPDCDGQGVTLVGTCMRAEFWKYIGVPVTNPITAGGRLKMEMGNLCEDMTLGHAAALFIMARQVEFWLRPELTGLTRSVHGYADFVLVNEEDGSLELGENKSGYGHYFTKSVMKARAIKPEWWLQVCLGLKGLMVRCPHNEVKRARFLILDRGNGNRVEITREVAVEDVDDVVTRCIKRWGLLEEYLAHGGERLPPAEYRDVPGKKKFGHWRCGYCSYLDRCKAVNDIAMEASDV